MWSPSPEAASGPARRRSKEGLVDGIAGFEEALEQARDLAGLERNAGWVKVKAPRASRPSPGRDVEDRLAEVSRAARGLKTTQTWAILPYEILESAGGGR